jgi:hypothetical protein
VPPDWLSRFQDAYVAELLDWVTSIQTDRPAVPRRQRLGRLRDMQVTAACIQSLRSGQVVPVQLPERPSLYN